MSRSSERHDRHRRARPGRRANRFAALFAVGLASAAWAADGTLDPTFGGGAGIRALAYDFGGDLSDRCGDLAANRSGVVAVGGTSASSLGDLDWAVSWLDASGATLFARTFFFDLGGTLADRVGAVAFDLDDRTLVAGTAAASDRTALRVCRLVAGGSGNDPGWNGGACVPYDLGAATDLSVRRIAETPDGGILVAGSVVQPASPTSDENWFVLKLTSSGGIDASFGFFGVRVLAWNIVARGTDRLTDMAVDRRTGEIFLIGSMESSLQFYGQLAKLTPSGNLDLSWGPLGGTLPIFLRDGGIELSSSGQAVLLDPEHARIWVAVQADSPTGIQLGTQGIADDGNSAGLPIEFTWNGSGSVIARMSRQSDGRLLVAGSTDGGTKIKLSRLLPIGTYFADLDPSFGTGGTATAEPDLLGWGVGESVCGLTVDSGRPVVSSDSDRGDIDQLVSRWTSALIFADGFETEDTLEWTPLLF